MNSSHWEICRMHRVTFARKCYARALVSLVITGFWLPAYPSTVPITINSFKIDQTEVTIGQFTAFADETGLVTAAERDGGGYEWGAGWQQRPGWNFRSPTGEPAQANEPAVHISWEEAFEYCKYVGGRLPTKEEWTTAAYTEYRENAADPYVTGRTYPYPVGTQPEGMNNNRKNHVAVATTKAGVNGLNDMGANVWEWLADRKDSGALTAGGSWWYGADKTKSAGMQWKPAKFYVLYIGFRCVYDL